MNDSPAEWTSTFSTAASSRIEPDLKSLSLEAPVFVTLALTSELPTISILTARGDSLLPRSTETAVAAAVKRRLDKNFMMIG